METQRQQPKRQPKKLDHTLKKTKKLVLHVYGMSSVRIDSAIQEIEKLCKDAKKQKLLRSPQVQDFVSMLTHEQVVTYCRYFIKCVGLICIFYFFPQFCFIFSLFYVNFVIYRSYDRFACNLFSSLISRYCCGWLNVMRNITLVIMSRSSNLQRLMLRDVLVLHLALLQKIDHTWLPVTKRSKLLYS